MTAPRVSGVSLRSYTHFQLLESDVYPLRAHWVDALERVAAGSKRVWVQRVADAVAWRRVMG